MTVLRPRLDAQSNRPAARAVAALRAASLAALLAAGSAGPAATERAVAPRVAAVPTGLIITEVKPDPAGQPWVELYNTDASIVETAGMTLCANNVCSAFALPSAFGTNVIPQDSIVIAADAGKWLAAHPTFFGTLGQAGNPSVLTGLKAEGDSLTLHAAGDGRRVDSFTWGSPGPTAGSNQTVQRDLGTGNVFLAPESPGGVRAPSAATTPQPAAPAPSAPGPTGTPSAVASPPASPPAGSTTGQTASPTAATAATATPTTGVPMIGSSPGAVTPTAGASAAAPPARPARPASLTPRGIVNVTVDRPAPGETVTGTVAVSGSALSASGNPVDRIWLAMDGDARGGGTFLAAAVVGLARPELVASTGDERLANAGWEATVDTARYRGGWHWLVVFAHEAGQPDNAGWDVAAVDVYVGP